jgi:allantoinase
LTQPVPERRNVKFWPDNANIVITFVVPWEAWPENFGTKESHEPTGSFVPPASAVHKKNLSAWSEREYGDRAGLPRLLDLFRRYGIKTTFLVNGTKVLQFPDMMRSLYKEGHELASESYIHEYAFMMTREQEFESISKTKDAIKKTVGNSPAGHFSPGHGYTVNTPEILAELGFLWWGDPIDDDLPYALKIGDKRLVVVPYVLRGANDFSTYTSARTPRDLLQIWKDNFDYLYREGELGSPKIFALNLHPFVAGVPYRAKIVEEFLQYAKEHPKVWYATRGEIAEYWLKNSG